MTGYSHINSNELVVVSFVCNYFSGLAVSSSINIKLDALLCDCGYKWAMAGELLHTHATLLNMISINFQRSETCKECDEIP